MNRTSPGRDKNQRAVGPEAGAHSNQAAQCGLEVQDLFYYYQPILGNDGQPVIYEALVRWLNPEGIILPPVHFLQGLLSGDDDTVNAFTAHTIDSAAAALTDNDHIYWLSINLSPAQICRHETLAHLASLPHALRRRLMIEITEDKLPERETYSLWLGETAALGIDLVLDDVKPDDLPQRLLKHLPVEGVKLDRSLLPLLTGPNPDRELVETVRSLRRLKLSVTAEGVEHVRQLEPLTALGCNRFQGFGLGMPLPGLHRLPQMPAHTVEQPRISLTATAH